MKVLRRPAKKVCPLCKTLQRLVKISPEGSASAAVYRHDATGRIPCSEGDENAK